MQYWEIVDWENLLTKIGNEIVAFIGKTSNLYNPILEVMVLLFKTIVVFGILFICLYVISIPLQVVAYGIIMPIMYFIDKYLFWRGGVIWQSRMVRTTYI